MQSNCEWIEELGEKKLYNTIGVLPILLSIVFGSPQWSGIVPCTNWNHLEVSFLSSLQAAFLHHIHVGPGAADSWLS